MSTTLPLYGAAGTLPTGATNAAGTLPTAGTQASGSAQAVGGTLPAAGTQATGTTRPVGGSLPTAGTQATGSPQPVGTLPTADELPSSTPVYAGEGMGGAPALPLPVGIPVSSSPEEWRRWLEVLSDDQVRSITARRRPSGVAFVHAAGQTTFSASVNTTTGYATIQWWDGTITTAGSGNPGSNISLTRATPSSGAWDRKMPLGVVIHSTNASGNESGAVTALDISTGTVVMVDVAGNASLQSLSINSLLARELDLRGLTGLTDFTIMTATLLERVDLSDCPNLYSVNLPTVPLLQSFTFAPEARATLGLLTLQYATGSTPWTLDLRGCTALESLNLAQSTSITQILTDTAFPSACPNLGQFTLTSVPAPLDLVFDGQTNLTDISVGSSGVRSIRAVACTGVSAVEAPSTPLQSLVLLGLWNLSTIQVSDCPALVEIELDADTLLNLSIFAAQDSAQAGPAIAAVDWSGATGMLSEFNVYGVPLPSLPNIPASANYWTLNFNGCGLNEAAVNALEAVVGPSELNGAWMDLRGNAMPTGTALTYFNFLVSDCSWTIYLPGS